MEMFKTLLRPSEPKQGDNPNPEGLRCAGGESRDTPSLPRNGAHSPLPGNQDVTNGEPAIEGDETSKEEKPHGDATADSTGFFQGISRDLKRQGITPDDLFTVLPPFAMDWDSTRDVSQCVLCAKPIDLLSRKVSKTVTGTMVVMLMISVVLGDGDDDGGGREVVVGGSDGRCVGVV